MKKAISMGLIALTLAITGCASVGNERIRNISQEDLSSKIVKGVTTKAQVREYLGAADFTSFTDSGNEIWRYAHVKATAKPINFVPIVSVFASGSNEEKKEIVFFFDKNGVVQNYTMSETKGESRQGIGSQ